MTGLRSIFFLGVWGAAIVLAPAAYGDGFENIPTGSRTAAMGGAGTAGGSDSAMPTLNPAGLAAIPGSVVSLSASLYQVGAISVPHFVSDQQSIRSRWGDLQVSQPGLQSTELSTFPSGLAYFLHLGDREAPTVLAASLSVPRNVSRRFIQNVEYLGTGVAIKDDLTKLVEEQTLEAAFSWASAFGSLRIGASLLGSYTEALSTFDQSELVVLGTARFDRVHTEQTQDGESFDAGLLVGLQWDAAEWLKLGLSLRTPSIHLGGSFSGSEDETLVEGGSEPVVSAIQSDGELTLGFPLRIGGGVEVRGGDWAAALDVSAFLPRSGEWNVSGTIVRSDLGGGVGDSIDRERALSEEIETRTVINIAAGLEYKLTASNWLRAGLFTDFTALESLDAGKLAAEKPKPLSAFPISRFGASAGWGTIMGPIDTTFGVRGSFGSGQIVRISPDSRYGAARTLELTSARAVEVLAFVSAAIDVSDLAKSSSTLAAVGE